MSMCPTQVIKFLFTKEQKNNFYSSGNTNQTQNMQSHLKLLTG